MSQPVYGCRGCATSLGVSGCSAHGNFTYTTYTSASALLATPEKPVQYWVEVDPETYNPTGAVCWACCHADKPIEGFWILVEQVEDKK